MTSLAPQEIRAINLPAPMATTLDTGSSRGAGLTGAASRSYSVVRQSAEHTVCESLLFGTDGQGHATTSRYSGFSDNMAPRVLTSVYSGSHARRASGLQARGWEEAAVLSELQQQALDLISDHCAQRPLPDHVRLFTHRPPLPDQPSSCL